MEWVLAGLGLLLGFLLGFFYSRISFRKAEMRSMEKSFQISAENRAFEMKVQSTEAEKTRLQLQCEQDRMTILELSKDLATFRSNQFHLEERTKAQNDFIENFRKQTKIEFENLAQQILDSKSKTFTEQTERNLESLLKPLKERIGDFEKKVDATYKTEANERIALKTEIGRLILLNEKMTQETTQLTQALKGDSKFQGDWGELVLEKILEASGLRESHEYTVQRQHQDEHGEKFKPDVVVNLPDTKHIVVDSKVSLKAYELYCRADDTTRSQYLDLHLKSILKHIEDLSEKHYSKLKGINSPEFVFLFMPIEPAYLLAAQNDTDLATRAWKKGVAIVTATTLLTSLKTVASIWRLENQNKNALEIAQEGAKLYDKFVGFLDDFEKIGKTFETGQLHFSNAMGKLKEGPGNIFRKMEHLRELGASPNKRIRQDLLDQ